VKKTIAYISTAAIAIAVFVSLTGFFGDKKMAVTKSNELWVELEAGQADQFKIPIPSLAPLVRRVEGSVLVVKSEFASKRQQLPQGLEDSPFGDLPFFFGPPQGRRPNQQQRKDVAFGSGFIIHPSGYALTNNHVIENASSIKIKVGSNLKEYEAEVVGTDPDYDVALIKIKSDRKDWPVIPLGDSAKSQVGDFAVAIGNPLGFEQSVSSGIISARGRRDVHPSGRNGLFDFMQIDAPINPGNSGGPLLNLSGEAIGINTAMAAGNGIGFTIPINQVKQILPQLKDFGKASRAFLGVEVQPLSDDLAKSMGLPTSAGALVRRVEPGTPAAKAGIVAGDVIAEFDGEVIPDASTLQLRAAGAVAGKTVTAKVVRGGKTIALSVTPEKRPGEELSKKGNTPDQKGQTFSLESLGFSAVTLDDNARDRLKLDKGVDGARVSEVDPYSIAGQSDIRANDVIIKVNSETIKTAKQLQDVIGKAAKDSILQILLVREKSVIFTYLQKP
jgi:serine protease Do